MSEYQSCEFRVIDQPLTREQTGKLRKLSTRADITPTSFTNTYHYGDFRGDPRKLMGSYFDAHVCVSNFGTATFMLRLPSGVLSQDTLTRYFTGEDLKWWGDSENTILQWQLNTDDPPDGWVAGEDWLDQLLPIRDELIRGDYRSLYIGWLSSIEGESPEENQEEPREPEAQQRKALEDQKKRQVYLAGLVPRFTELWSTPGTLAEEQEGIFLRQSVCAADRLAGRLR